MTEFAERHSNVDTSTATFKVKTEQETQLKASVKRQGQLRQALAELAQSPESVGLDSLIASYQTAQLREVNFAADAITAIYLRSGLAIRQRLRVALTAVIREQACAALAQALSIRLGALLMSCVPPSSQET